MPRRLRPTAPTAPDAVLVGDPGRALLLAQELLKAPKMSNHARGLWGYYGSTPAGRPMTIQSTGMGGPSAALVLDDLAELGVRRAIRVGTCVGLDVSCAPGDLLLVREAIAVGGSAVALGIDPGASVTPNPELTERLLDELGNECRAVAIASVDAHPYDVPAGPGIVAADMQTAPLLARANALGIKAAAVLIVTEGAANEGHIESEELERLERRAGRGSADALSA
jgi:uridine phosphorylase